MKCIICGKEIEKSRFLNKTLCSSECHSVNFWNECLDEDAIIIKGVCYHDGGMKPKEYRGPMGHGGRLFTIKMNNGKVITTNNLWCSGNVPEDRNIEDNATFLSN